MNELLSFLPVPHRLACGYYSATFLSKEGRPFAYRDDGQIYTWGLDGSMVVSKPDVKPYPIRVLSVASSGERSTFLTADGKVYEWMWKGYIPTTPTLINLPFTVISVSFGYESYCLVTVDGHVYDWRFVSGDKDDPIDLPAPCHQLQTSSYSDSYYALTTDGSVYTWGMNKWGQLGQGTVKLSLDPMRVMMAERVVSIASGDIHLLMLTSTGEVYGCGSNYYGQLGHVGTHKSCPVLFTLPSTCKMIACGCDTSFVILDTGEVYGCGDDANGELGIGRLTIGDRPTLLKFESSVGTSVEVIDGGKIHTNILTVKGELYQAGGVGQRQSMSFKKVDFNV
ncbi:MAG: hypothetical protein WC208_13780 [Gallionella sp.]|jgi:alpha-tubulin suppressor-like RCC1 family protein